MTIGVWFKTVDPGTGSSPYHFWDTSFLIDGDYPSYTSDFGLGITGGHIVWGIGNGNNSIYGDGDIERASANTYNDGIWHYVTATRDTTGALNIYVDGSLDTDPSSIQGTSGSGPLNQSKDLGIGGEKAGGRNYYGDKSIAAVHMYDRVLNSSEIAQNYNAMRSFFGR
jgi:hypothetical protein